MMADCKLCIKGTQCQICRKKKDHSAACGSARKCDACVTQKKNCQCVSKQYCIRYSEKKGKCRDCEELSPKCSSDSMILVFLFKI